MDSRCQVQLEENEGGSTRKSYSKNQNPSISDHSHKINCGRVVARNDFGIFTSLTLTFNFLTTKM